MFQKIRVIRLTNSKRVLLLSLSCLLFSSMNCSNSSNDTNGVLNILPNGYIGRVVIMYDQKDGKDQKIEGGRRVYEIPKCGFLKTKFSRPTGSLGTSEDQYFKYIYANGDTIPYLSNTSVIDSSRLNEVFSFSQGIGGFSFDDGIEYEASEYIIDSLKNIGKYSAFRIRKSDFEKCR